MLKKKLLILRSRDFIADDILSNKIFVQKVIDDVNDASSVNNAKNTQTNDVTTDENDATYLRRDDDSFIR